MTITETSGPSTETTTTVDPYRDIHKGIRSMLFSVTSEAGRIDPSDRAARETFAAHVRAMEALLEFHAGHEDAYIQPVLAQYEPALFEQIARDHNSFAARVPALATAAAEAVDGPRVGRRARLHNLYLDVAGFTAVYLQHQEVEERVVGPALVAAIGPEEVAKIDHALVASIPPDVLAEGLAVMVPAMNIDDRAEMLGGMQLGAPPQVFAGVWALAQSVLEDADARALAVRLGL